MRICSLVPGATEVVAALGLAEALVGISHECDHPPAVRHVPVIVQPVVDSENTDSAGIDRQIKALADSGQPLYRLDERRLAEARPDIILTQDVCHVCAVTPHELERAMQSLSARPQVLTLAPHRLSDVLDDVERIGLAVGAAAEGSDFARMLRGRLAAVRARWTGRHKPRVACLEWLDPPYVAGHWVPDMVEAAGAEDVLGHAGRPSTQVTVEQVLSAAPDMLMLMPCGFSVARTVAELTLLCRKDPARSRVLHAAPSLYTVDAGSYFSRPGPRLVDGVELMADVFAGLIDDRPSDSALNLNEHACLAGLPR